MSRPRLIFLSGPLKRSIFPITDQPLTIGRAPDNVIRLDDELVSGHHALVMLKEGRPWLRDGDTRNGTFIDGRAHLEKFLEHGDRPKFGSSISVCYELEEDPDIEGFVEEEATRSGMLPTLRADYTSRRELNVHLRAVGEAFGAMAEALNEIRDLNSLLDRLLEEAFKIIPAKRGAFLLNGAIPASGKWILEVYRQRYRPAAAAFIPNSKDIDDVYRLRAPNMSRGITAAICVPLILQDRMRGILYMDTTDSPSGFEPEDLKFLRKIAAFAVSGLRLARQVESLENERDTYKEQVQTDDAMVGESAAIQTVREFMGKAAAEDVTVLITGETGTGKGVLARAIHQRSRRKDHPFVTINCGDVLDSLLPSELFGHVKGAFTDAREARKGKLKKAEHGTAFLDEIGDMSIEAQRRLLNFLQEKTFEPVGGDETVESDVRVIAATNVDLKEAIAQGKFRQDLFYRLNIFGIRMPSLRERLEDIPLLTAHFIKIYGAERGVTDVAPDVMDALLSHQWPGNIRELESIIQAATIHAGSGLIHLKHLPEPLRDLKPGEPTSRLSFNAAGELAKNQERFKKLKLLMAKHRDSVPAVAFELGYTESYVYRLLRECKEQ